MINSLRRGHFRLLPRYKGSPQQVAAFEFMLDAQMGFVDVNYKPFTFKCINHYNMEPSIKQITQTNKLKKRQQVTDSSNIFWVTNNIKDAASHN